MDIESLHGADIWACGSVKSFGYVIATTMAKFAGLSTIIKDVLGRTQYTYWFCRGAKDYFREVIPKSCAIRFLWWQHFREPLNTKNPQTYNEKLQWAKLYAENCLARRCADKLSVRDYVSERIGNEYLNQLLGVYESVADIVWPELPNSLVLKCTHDSGSIVIVPDKHGIRRDEMRFLEYCLAHNYGRMNKEWVYDKVRPLIIAEGLLTGCHGEAPSDYKVFCFNGVPQLIALDTDRFSAPKRDFYDTSWNRLELKLKFPNSGQEAEKPNVLAEMIRQSGVLAQPFNHVRIDWFIVEDRLVFGEMTFFHGGGTSKFRPSEWSRRVGSWFEVAKDLSHSGARWPK